nr:probable ADP-ribosylation factor GTPase-activating protein AGD15 [Malus domestica]
MPIPFFSWKKMETLSKSVTTSKHEETQIGLRQVNEKGNSYWEKNCHQILGLRKLFVPSMRKDWVAKNAKQPAPKPVDMSISSNSLVKDRATCGAPKETRRHSLEEAMLFTVAEAAPPVARSRGSGCTYSWSTPNIGL